MIDLRPAPVPELSEEWMASRRTALVGALSRRQHRPMRWVGLAGATGVAATVSTFVIAGASAPSAFAGWSAAPTAPATGQLTAADADCQARLAQAVQFPPSNKSSDAASLVPELNDVRGPYTVTVYTDGGRNGALCVSAPGAILLRWFALSGAPVGPGTIAVDRVSFLDRDGQTYTLVVGQTGTGVTAVTLALGNGSDVTATSGDGLFVAWWPGSESVTSAAVTTGGGVSTQQLDLPAPPVGTKTPPPGAGTQPSGSSGNSTVCLIRACP
jgi:hypothetical protein